MRPVSLYAQFESLFFYPTTSIYITNASCCSPSAQRTQCRCIPLTQEQPPYTKQVQTHI